ncbi:MAG: hypothetical protein AB7W16_16410 [Candidatus Obscuribacterales bacterium]
MTGKEEIKDGEKQAHAQTARSEKAAADGVVGEKKQQNLHSEAARKNKNPLWDTPSGIGINTRGTSDEDARKLMDNPIELVDYSKPRGDQILASSRKIAKKGSEKGSEKGADKSTERSAGERSRPAEHALSRNLTATELAELKHLGISAEQAALLRTEFETNSKAPFATLSNLMRANDVVGIGEIHYVAGHSNNPIRDLGPTAIKTLAAAGATHLALEIPHTLQPLLDNFEKTGVIDQTRLAPTQQTQDYLKIIEAGRACKLKLVAIDVPEPWRTEVTPRDIQMASAIKSILNNQKGARVIAWVGSMHLEHGQGRSGLCAAERLKQQGVRIATVGSEVPDVKTILSKVVPDLTRTVSIDMAKARNIGNLDHIDRHNPYSVGTKYNWWDHVIVFPRSTLR